MWLVTCVVVLAGVVGMAAGASPAVAAETASDDCGLDSECLVARAEACLAAPPGDAPKCITALFRDVCWEGPCPFIRETWDPIADCISAGIQCVIRIGDA